MRTETLFWSAAGKGEQMVQAVADGAAVQHASGLIAEQRLRFGQTGPDIIEERCGNPGTVFASRSGWAGGCWRAGRPESWSWPDVVPGFSVSEAFRRPLSRHCAEFSGVRTARPARSSRARFGPGMMAAGAKTLGYSAL